MKNRGSTAWGIGPLIVGLCLNWSVNAQNAAPGNLRQTELNRLILQDCAQCHGMGMAGETAPPLTAKTLASKPRGALVQTILEGRHRTPMPAWASTLSEGDATWIVDRLLDGAIDVPR